MKKTILNTLFFTALAFQSMAQVVVTNATFPSVGDTLKYAEDPEPMGIEITAPGGDQFWDFTSLIRISTTETLIESAAIGDNVDDFPTANISIPILGGQDSPVPGGAGRLYVNSSDSEYSILGYGGTDPIGLGLGTVVPFTPPIIQRRSPMSFIDNNTSSYTLALTISGDSIPEELLSQLPVPVTPDSIRITSTTNRTDLVDAWGMLTIPGGTYSVLREKRVEIRESALEALVSLGPISNWVDVTDLLPIPLLGADTTTTYNFISNTEKEEIAVISVDNNDLTPIAARFKDNGELSTSIVYENTGKADIYAQPNPAIRNTRINIVNVKPGKYTFRLFNILGEEIMDRDLFINGNDHAFSVSLDSLSKGTYLYNVSDNNGKVISTKRLMVIRP